MTLPRQRQALRETTMGEFCRVYVRNLALYDPSVSALMSKFTHQGRSHTFISNGVLQVAPDLLESPR